MEQIRILIVEDEPNLAYTLSHMIKRATLGDVEIINCNTVEDALKTMEEKSIDLVISDLNLSGDSGMELLTNIRQDYPKTSTILMTAYGSPQVESEARRLADAYLAKPFSFTDLQRVVQKVLHTW
jgi:DNA-binding NtrC family response regulator